SKRVVFHFLPKHGSWLNQIEIWLSILSRKLLRRGIFESLHDLEVKILEYIMHWNNFWAHPFAWTYNGKPLKL
ncbi:MAG: transposase, partial [bacterium]